MTVRIITTRMDAIHDGAFAIVADAEHDRGHAVHRGDADLRCETSIDVVWEKRAKTIPVASASRSEPSRAPVTANFLVTGARG